MSNRKPLVLVVDDDLKSLKLIHDILTYENYEVITASDWDKCQKQLNSNSNIDLIELDVMMPGFDGFSVCSCIKTNRLHQNIPIIFITALDDDTSQVEGFEVGGSDFINKPIKKEILKARIKVHVKLKQSIDSLNLLLEEKEKLILQLNEAANNIKTLKSLLPICANCKKIRDDDGYWQQVESYITKETDARFSHSLCPDCIKKLYPDMADEILSALTKQKGI